MLPEPVTGHTCRRKSICELQYLETADLCCFQNFTEACTNVIQAFTLIPDAIPLWQHKSADLPRSTVLVIFSILNLIAKKKFDTK